jgi:ATP-dependent DNA helicase RecG
VLKTVQKTVLKTVEKTVLKTDAQILNFIKDNNNITIKELQEATGLTRRGVQWQIQKLKDKGLINRIGPDKGGHWEIINEE